MHTLNDRGFKSIFKTSSCFRGGCEWKAGEDGNVRFSLGRAAHCFAATGTLQQDRPRHLIHPPHPDATRFFPQTPLRIIGLAFGLPGS